MSAYTDEQVIAAVGAVLRGAFPDRDFPDALGPRTRFFGDLGMVSIDAIVLAEHLERHFGQRLPFAKFLAGLRARQSDDLEVGEVVAFLRENVHARP